MRKIIYVLIVAPLGALAIPLFFGGHGDGFVHPKIQVFVKGKEGKPIQKASILFIEEMFEQDYNSSPKEFIERSTHLGQFSETDAEGSALINARFGIAVHFVEIMNKPFFSNATIFNNGKIIITKHNYKENRILIDKRKYEKEILDEETLVFKVVLEKLWE